MSELTTGLQTSNQGIWNSDFSKIFLGSNETIQMSYTNSTGAEKILSAGLVIGRIATSEKALPLKSDASDGSQFPMGVLMNESITVADGVTATITVAIKGYVNESKLIFDNGTDTLATVVSSRTIRDRIAADNVGIILKKQLENTKLDNQ